MTDPNEILYPQITPIYNKLLQIGVAIVLLLMILNLSIMGVDDSEEQLDQHFNQVAKQYLEQAVNTAKILIASNDKKQLQAFVNTLNATDFVQEARLYDLKGQVIAETDTSHSVNHLFGIERGSEDKSGTYVPFVEEIRGDKLQGYLRLNLLKADVVATLQTQINSQFELFRIMLIVAVGAGFLFTRGFTRFSRQSLRLAKPSRKKSTVT